MSDEAEDSPLEGITGNVYVVTGAAGDIGTATARCLAGMGGRVVMTDLVGSKGPAVAAALANDMGRDVRFMPLDVSNSNEVNLIAQQIEIEIGQVRGLVVNAGIALPATAINHSDEAWRRTMSVNLDGAFYCARAFGRRMRGRGGSIVTVSSIAGHKAVRPETHVAYGTSKAALAHMTALLGVEWAPDDVRVNCVAPGYTDTEILTKLRKASPDTFEIWMRDTPIGRLLRPEEVGNVVAFLLSDLSSGMTGAVVAVDGGYSRQ